MPGPVKFEPTTAVFPETLSRAFTEVQTFAGLVSECHDGNAQRLALVEAPRHAWRLTKHLPPADLVELRDFLVLHIADHFYFYNPKETSPPNTTDPTGAATAGRYTVRLDSSWAQSTGIVFTDTAIELVEVASYTDIGGSGGSVLGYDKLILAAGVNSSLYVADDVCPHVPCLYTATFEVALVLATNYPVGGSTTAVVNLNGVPLFTDDIVISPIVGALDPTIVKTDFAIASIDFKEYLTLDITEVGSTYSGSDLVIAIRVRITAAPFA